ncbi:hypothetical protein Y032_0355g3325 [Ancylostoma ceylanicum]|uniref:Uncharacterized protein n=1 Tax=Ancylostoma ceylanicum TaxID=53326 RepID=A0A016RX11_9BILA|nr:hypothetical protein Y032_0355g3325 [Ancylostoma ceylanicum]
MEQYLVQAIISRAVERREQRWNSRMTNVNSWPPKRCEYVRIGKIRARNPQPCKPTTVSMIGYLIDNVMSGDADCKSWVSSLVMRS